MTVWAARFRNGPAALAPEHIFVVGVPWQEIRLIPLPDPHGWTVIGGSDMPPDPDPVPYPGEAMYHLVAVEPHEQDDSMIVAWYECKRSQLSPG